HAGYMYSGPCAAHFYAALDKTVESVILLGVNHWAEGAKVALSPADHWETPLGPVRVDHVLADWLKGNVPFLAEDSFAHLREHSIEVQVPFLQRVLGDFSFLPISISHLSEYECSQLGEALAHLHEEETSRGKKTVLIASSDLNHYLSPQETHRLDNLALDQVLQMNPRGLLRTVERAGISMCGVIPAAVMLMAAQNLGAKRARLLKHCHSGDVAPMDEVVGYASVAVIDDLD
ncbi:MAG: AmmeMemoRadiSam system protein B, partial [Deltaproteobacteria bacterium]|nr:AmmeMemoRadiSam system protein B [Deltaproteobacteria bacterium]